MTIWTLIRRSLRFHARAHMGVVLGAAIGSAALIGALIVGDSVRESLTARALSRLGPVHFALSSQDRFFQTSLVERLENEHSSGSPALGTGAAILYLSSFSPITAVLNLPGVVVAGSSSARANKVNVFGVDAQRWPAAAGWAGRRDYANLRKSRAVISPDTLQAWRSGETALINEALARQLSVRPGDDILLRVRKPSALGMDAAISPRDQNSVALRFKVGAIVPSQALGDFGLSAQAFPPNNLFLPGDLFARKLGIEGRANILTASSAMAVGENSSGGPLAKYRGQTAAWLLRHSLSRPPAPGASVWHYDQHNIFFRASQILQPQITAAELPDEVSSGWLDTEIQRAWLPEDGGISVRSVEQPQTLTRGEYIRPLVEITSSRIFLEPAVTAAALAPRQRVVPLRSGYLADTTNDIAFARFVTNATPILTYLANLISTGERAAPYSMVTAANAPFAPANMRDDEVLVNEWLAEDLGVKPGNAVQLAYYAVDSGSKLVERTNSFRVRAIVPLKGIYADRTLMPAFPGVAEAESTHDWDTGFPLVYKIRNKDELYWRKYRGTPKAFVTLAAGQAMWGSRFGNLTAIRFEVPTNSFASTYREAVYRNLLTNLNPADLGLRFEPVREQALKAVEQSQDFGQLFIGFSLFLVVAALLLMAMLFQFSLEQRATEVGTLLALGFTPRKIRRLLLLEGIALGLIGGVLGACGGIFYAKAMLYGLATIWRKAVTGTVMGFCVTPTTLAIGFCSGALVAALTIWLTLRKQARQPARELLAGEIEAPKSRSKSWGLWIGAVSGLGAVAIIGEALAKHATADADSFFSAGSLLLISGLAICSAWLAKLRLAKTSTNLTLRALGIRAAARRRKRSVATVALLASGAFVIIAIGAFRLDANQDATERSSGTGGFALLGDSAMPVVQDLNSSSGREALGLNPSDLAGVRVVPFRVRDGDEASCLNLNRAQRPRLLGVKPELLRGCFTFADVAPGCNRQDGWSILAGGKKGSGLGLPTEQATVIPAVADANSIEWALGKKLGDTIDYTDEQGRTFKVRLVGAIANSLLQGSLIIDEAQFVKRFPNESGYRMFLLDMPTGKMSQVSSTLSRALQDYGLELVPAARRLNEFNAVQNTYLGTFQVLGGLGLLLGSAGLGIVVLRNVLERRGELGLLLAVGFRRRQLQWLILSEHGALLGLGLALGLVAASVAVLPSLLSPAAQLPYRSLGLTLAAVCLNGLIWTWAATRVALKGDLLEVLRNE